MNSELPKTYTPAEVENKIYQFWERGKWFTPKINKRKKPFSILLPLPNANDPLHMGHALFTIQDIIIRYQRMKGNPVLWLPGGDHAGIETQFIFEKKLAKEGKSRFDFDRKSLYQMIADYVEKNKNINHEQLKKMGFSLDWTRYHYSLEPKIVSIVMDTFRKLHKDGFIYRGKKLVNFCTKCGTAFSDLEVEYIEKEDSLYYLNYGSLQIATTRPETIFADLAIAVHPKDKRYKVLIGQKAVVPIINKEIPIISDNAVDINFGTGALKVTPGHDQIDFEIGERNNLETIVVIDQKGRMKNLPEKYKGMTVKNAKEKVVKDLQLLGKLVKTEPLKHSVGVCYRCKQTIEPIIMPQWFVRVKHLAKPAIKAIEKKKVKIIPEKRFKKMYLDWMKNIHDWNISRQIVWGPQIPVWYCLDCNPEILIHFLDKNGQKISGVYQDLKEKYSFEDIKHGLQSLTAGENSLYSLNEKPCKNCLGKNILQETDTFDTWFLSGQWPLTALGYPAGKDFKYFYPTSVLDTLWDILFFWVARMMMFGLYLTKEVPFKIIHIHCRVVDAKGQKMSKSKGNVVNPIDMIEKYGADALRFALIFGSAPGTDIHINEDKVRGMRNFCNKIWNASRFILSHHANPKTSKKPNHKEDRWILKETKKTAKKVTGFINDYRFDFAAEEIYHFFWHKFCDKYIETSKRRREEAQPVLLEVLKTSLKLLHPFIPFITEEIYQKLPIYPPKFSQGKLRRVKNDLRSKKEKCLMVEEWPGASLKLNIKDKR